MIRGDQGHAVVEPGYRAVAELRDRPRTGRPERQPPSEVGLPADPTEPNDHTHTGEEPQLGDQVRRTARELVERRFVIGRRAPHGRGHVGVEETETIAPALGRWLAGEARVMERVEEPVAAAIPGEHPPRAIAAVRGGRQPHQEEPRSRAADTRQRPGPVALAEVAPRRGCRDGLAMLHEPGTPPTGDDASTQAADRARILQSGGIVTR